MKRKTKRLYFQGEKKSRMIVQPALEFWSICLARQLGSKGMMGESSSFYVSSDVARPVEMLL